MEPITPITPISGPEYWALQALQSIPYQVFAQNLEGRIMVANRATALSFGHTSADAIILKTVFDLFPADTAATMRSMELQVIETGKEVIDHEHHIVETNGRRRCLRTSRTPIWDAEGKILGVVCTSNDVTESKASDELLVAQANLLDMIAQSAPLADIFSKIIAVVTNHIPAVQGAIQLLSTDAQQLIPRTAQFLPETLGSLLEPADNSLTRAMLSAIARGDSFIAADLQTDPQFDDVAARLAACDVRAVWCMPVVSLEGRAIGILSLFSQDAAAPTAVQSDVIAMATHMVSSAIERQESQERNKFLANHDALTGLPNRLMFLQGLAAALEAAAQNHRRAGLAFFDLDNFKLINDSLGHAAGDNLLKTVADRARRSIRAGDLVARLGGDEFIMLLADLAPQDDVNEKRFEHIRELISAPVGLNDRAVQVTCSMGVAYFPEHARDGDDLIARADMAMYRAKQLGRDNISFFNVGMSSLADEKLSLNSALREAVARNEFMLQYQPQVDLTTQRVFGAEALVRWRHPSLGLLLPGDFIETAEQTGVIIALGDWVLNEACRQNKLWQDGGLAPIVVSVNVSARQFLEANLVARICAALERSGLDAKYLELELTESLVMQEGSTQKMLELNALGIKLAIDDFGTGYSSLSALKNFPVSRLKIDSSFVRDISSDERDQAITSAIVVMAKKLRMSVTGEGVETADQMELLNALGCHKLQGFYFSKPVDAIDFPPLLAAGAFESNFAGIDRSSLIDP